MDAAKVRLDGDAALRMARAAAIVIAARGRSVVEFDLTRDKPDEDALRKALLGPTGNLRAPTLRCGRMLVVGFHAETYKRLFG